MPTAPYAAALLMVPSLVSMLFESTVTAAPAAVIEMAPPDWTSILPGVPFLAAEVFCAVPSVVVTERSSAQAVPASAVLNAPNNSRLRFTLALLKYDADFGPPDLAGTLAKPG